MMALMTRAEQRAFGFRLTELRGRLNASSDQLAMWLGMQPRRLQQVERGLQEPNRQTRMLVHMLIEDGVQVIMAAAAVDAEDRARGARRLP